MATQTLTVQKGSIWLDENYLPHFVVIRFAAEDNDLGYVKGLSIRIEDGKVDQIRFTDMADCHGLRLLNPEPAPIDPRGE